MQKRMELIWIVSIVIFIIVAVVVFKFITGVLKTFFTILLLIALALLGIAGYVVYESYGLMERLGSGDGVLLVSEDGEVTHGARLGNGLLSSEELEQYIAVTEGADSEELVFVADKSLFGTGASVNFIENYKAGKIGLYPETIALKVMKRLPSSLFTSSSGKIEIQAPEVENGG